MDWVKHGKHLTHMFDEVVESNPYAVWDGVAGDVIRVADGSQYPNAMLTASFYKLRGTEYWMVYNHLVKTVMFCIENEKGGESLDKRTMPIAGFSQVPADMIFDSNVDDKIKEEIVYVIDRVS